MSADADRGPVAGVLLAAGTSSRMGQNKLLLAHDGTSLLRRAAKAALDAGLTPVIVVLGHEADRARAELAGLSCETVVNPRYEDGIVTSLHTGLVERYQTTTAPLAISDYEGVTAPPMLYDRALFPELFAIDDGRCGQQVVRRHRAEAEVLAWPTTALADVDVPADLDLLAGGR